MRCKALLFLSFLVITACKTAPQAKPATATPSQNQTLKQAYQHAFKVGSAVNADIVAAHNSKLTEIVPYQFSSITAENVMKAEVINPEPGIYNFAPADAFVEFGLRNNLFVIGHTLVWHNQSPVWFFTNQQGEPNTPAEQQQRMHDYIKMVASRYQGKVHAWDVVNEVIGDDGNYRPTVWVNRMGSGDELVKWAFRYAAQYAPGTELYYNDFNAWRPEKVKGIVRMVKMLQDAEVRIDGVGIQGHWGLNFPSNEHIQQAIDAYAALGLKVMITELDIDVLPLTREGQIIGTGMMHPQFQNQEFKQYLDPYPDGLPEAIQNQLTQRYHELFALFYRNRDKIDRVTLWGVHDAMSWKNGYPIPNRTNYPLLYDRNLQPKPALQTILGIPSKP